MKTFTYVIAPESGVDYIKAGKVYRVVGDAPTFSPRLGIYTFICESEMENPILCVSKNCMELNGKDWIIPEIGQWPYGWSNQQKFDCMVRANVEPNFDFIQDWLEQCRSMREKNLTAFGWVIPIQRAIKWIAGLFVITIMVACSKPDIKPEKSAQGFIQREKTL